MINFFKKPSKPDPKDIPVVLPTSVEALDTFVAEVISEFSLPNTDDTYELIATMIMHINPNVCHATPRYFADAVLKGLANKAAYDKLTIFRDNRSQAQAAQAAAQTAPAAPAESIPGVEPVQK